MAENGAPGEVFSRISSTSLVTKPGDARSPTLSAMRGPARATRLAGVAVVGVGVGGRVCVRAGGWSGDGWCARGGGPTGAGGGMKSGGGGTSSSSGGSGEGGIAGSSASSGAGLRGQVGGGQPGGEGRGGEKGEAAECHRRRMGNSKKNQFEGGVFQLEGGELEGDVEEARIARVGGYLKTG